ncbi:MAG: M48 family metalloprotease [Deltaproteobacteria bacterium]|jgi:predicted Zn-dependent protease|nr:M48 family metalloprotease [Deltaproteobacteria bacterium]MDX9762772.1 M48 family metalloprotease [Desulfomonilia bacterium]HPW69719.1 M48 family metalloprotease [Deltaproteobacteria bacterium]
MLAHMRRAICTALLLMFVCCPVKAAAMSFEEERKIADEIVTVLDAQGLIVHDQEITWPVKLVADRLADHVKDPIYSFKIHVIEDRSINAFAIPDGHVFVNTGTLLFVRDLDELAAVIGHEMGHVQMRHIPQTIKEQKKVTAVSIAGMLLGTLLSAKNPQIGSAMIFSSIGGGENIKLAYSRRFENEADEFGNNLMRASGFSPAAMNRFLVRLEPFSGGANIPEYLLTHPHITSRISGKSPDEPNPDPDEHYWMLHASVVGLVIPEEEARQRAQGIPDPYRRLALGLLETRRGRHEEALRLLDGLDIPVAYAYKGLNLAMAGKKDEAYPYLKNYGTSARTRVPLAEIMEERGEFDEAIAILSPYQKQNIQVDYKLGILYQKSPNEAMSHVSFARYFFKTGKYKASLYHIEKALAQGKALDAQVDKEMKEMKELIGKIRTS